MKKLLVSSLLVVILLVNMTGLLLPGYLSHEAQAAAPSKLRVNDVQYDSGSQRFIIDLSCQAGAAGTADKPRFSVRIDLIANIGNGDEYLSTTALAVKLAGAVKDSEGKVELEPIYIPWNSYQRGGDFEGTAIVVTKAVLKNRNGRDIGSVFVDITRYLQI
jgi:hypothetical protein